MTGKSLRDNIRKATVGSKRTFKSEIVDLAGNKIEVRQLSISARRDYMDAAISSKEGEREVDILKLQVNAIISSCYVPGTDDLVFESTDAKAIGDSVSGGYADEIWEAVQRMSNVTLEDAKKN